MVEQIRAAELTADHLGRRIRLDYTNDDDTFAIARLVMIRHKQVGKSADTETETRLDVELIADVDRGRLEIDVRCLEGDLGRLHSDRDLDFGRRGRLNDVLNHDHPLGEVDVEVHGQLHRLDLLAIEERAGRRLGGQVVGRSAVITAGARRSVL